MADTEEATTPMETLENTSDSDSSDNEAPSPKVEWLATSRAKRSTAGTRMTSLIQQEAEDDELELLFAEDENDEGFEMEGGDDSDVQMDSSDDDDDQGPPAPGAEELDGEKELLRKERQERMGKKRKNDHLPKAFQAKNKKVKIDPMAPTTTGKKAEMKEPRPKKKSERSSWIPTEVDAPVRVSHRSTTMQAKEELYKEMQKREELRLKQLANMEKAAARKAAQKKPEKTQEDRLAEAARIEKANAKSLNRWEEAERIREEEARARLEALHNRKMVGPVITWWSGKATYIGDQLKQVGKNVEVVAPPVKVPRKKRPSEMGLGDSATAKARLERQQSLPKTAMQQNGQASAPSSGPGTPLTPGFANGAAPLQGESAQGPQPPLQPTQATPSMLNGTTPLSGLSAPPSAPASPFPQPQLVPLVPSSSPVNNSQHQPPPPPPTPAVSVPPTPQNGTQGAVTTLPNITTPSTTTAPQPLPQLSAQPAQATPSNTGLYYNGPQSQSSTLPSPAAQPSAGPMPPSQISAYSMAPQNGPSASPLSIVPAAPQANSHTPPQQIKSELPTSMPPPSAFPVPHRHTQVTPPQSQGPHTSSAPPALNIHNALPQAPPAPPQPTTYATSNRLILSSFSDTALREKSTLNAILFRGNKFQKLPRPSNPPLCAITGLPAKFRDPKTGLPYVNSYAFKEIRRLERGEYKWSGLVGAYVGGVDRPAVVAAGTPPTTVPGAARGVPNRFTDPKAPPPPKQVKQEIKPPTTPALGTPAGSMGSMAPPPLRQGMPNTPTPVGMGQPIMTPGQFAAQNPLNSPAQTMGQSTPIQNTSPAPKQPNPIMAAALNKSASPAIGQQPSNMAANKQAIGAPFGMQPPATATNTGMAPAMKAASPVISTPAAPTPSPPPPISGAAASVAPVASTMAAATTSMAAVAPIMATVAPSVAPMNNVPAPGTSQPKA